MSDHGHRWRVGYVVDRFPAPSETFVANEVRGVVEAGAEVTVFALRPGTGPDAGVDVVRATDAVPSLAGALAAPLRMGPRSPRDLLTAVRRAHVVDLFAREARRRGIRHLHAHFASIPTTLALMVARLSPATVSFSAHARDVFVSPRGLPGKIAAARLCIACTDAAADRLRGLARPQDRSKIVRIHHGTDLKRFPFRRRGAPGRPAHVLAVGRFVPKKGFDLLLRACALLRERMPLRVTLAGEGPMAADLARLRDDLALAELVQLPGWTTYEDMADLYAQADVLAVPSILAPDGDRDGLPNVVVEAMASGLPVVGSRFAGIPEAVTDGETGLLCPPGDAEALAQALARALADARLLERLAAAARTRVERDFDCRRNSRLVLEALRRAAG